MYPFSIGVILDSFRTDTLTAIHSAKKLGIQGIQIYTTNGEMSPEQLVGSKRSEFLNIIQNSGLNISALCGDLGKGFTNKDQNPELIEKSKKILYMAKELHTDIVTTHIGVVPEDKTCDTYKTMQEACHKLAEYADSLHAHFAVETGPEPALRLKEFLDSLDSKGVAVNLDPANLVMVTGDDPVAAVYTLQDYIVHTHAKDGRNLRNISPEITYSDIESEIQSSKAFIELPLGQGDVDFTNYLDALNKIGYTGFLTIEREVGPYPEEDIAMAVHFLKNKIGSLE